MVQHKEMGEKLLMLSAEPKLPRPVVYRLPQYLARVRELRDSGAEWVSSSELARDLGLTSSTVRQDLSHLQVCGVSRRGYPTRKLEQLLSRVLGANRVHRVVIVGAGYLGTALALHGGLAEQGFQVCGIFDDDPAIIGDRVGPLRIQPMTELNKSVKEHRIEIGLITVPAAAAQEVADRLIAAGVRGLLNLAYAQVRVPERVALMDARLIANLQQLAYIIRNRNGDPVRSRREKEST